jgi:serine/threonine-protein kinase
MPNAQLIAAPRASTPAELGTSRGYRRAIPDDLLREASRRLGIMSLLAATLWIVSPLLDHLAFRAMTHGDPGWLRLDAADAICGASALASLALFFSTRKRDWDPQWMLDLGLGYLVLTGLALGLVFHWQPVPTGWQMSPVITWNGAVTLIFAAILPNTPRKTLVASLIAVSMNPLGMVISKARGTWDFGPASNVLLMHFPDYLMAGGAAVISHVVTRLGQQVAKAREMGSYDLGGMLGRGGMGEVYRATHRMLARPAAIKLIRPEMIGARNGETAQLAVKRFRREAETVASLRSPHTVELYDFGVTDDETLYFVMELLDGMTLEALVRRHGPLPAPRVIYILRQVCASLEEAHVRGLVHRDIKPANIHVGTLGLRCDFVKVLDFGLVKCVTLAGGKESLATAAGLTPGTPAYMAPEAALGDTVDGRADLYALGCVAYYSLTGALVFEAETGLQMMAKHLREDPVAPSQRTALPIPAALERLVLACLAKKPEDRPQSAAELARLLAGVEGEPWSEARAREWWAAHPTA